MGGSQHRAGTDNAGDGDTRHGDSPEIAGRLHADQRPGATGGSGLERRRGPGKRLSGFTKAAEEGEMTPEQFLFLVAIDEFKRANGKAYPAWSDVLEVIRLLGYRKVRSSELHLPRAEDWTEPADTPAGVRPEGWERRAA